MRIFQLRMQIYISYHRLELDKQANADMFIAHDGNVLPCNKTESNSGCESILRDTGSMSGAMSILSLLLHYTIMVGRHSKINVFSVRKFSDCSRARGQVLEGLKPTPPVNRCLKPA